MPFWKKESLTSQNLTGNLSPGLNSLNLTAGDRVCYLGKHQPGVVKLFLSCLLEGVVFCPLNYREPTEKLAKVIAAVRPSLLICDREFQDTVLGEVTQRTCLDELYPDGNLSCARLTPSVRDELVTALKAAATQDALYLPTSGTTGLSKIVRLSGGNILASANAHNSVSAITSEDCVLLSLPFFHIAGLMPIVRAALAGASILVPDSPSATDLEKSLSEATMLSLVPTVLSQLLELGKAAELKKLRLIQLGGSALCQELFQQIKLEQLPVYLSYGASECCSTVSLGHIAQLSERTECGSVLPGFEVSFSATGEIVISGDAVALEYLVAGGNQLSSGVFRSGDRGELRGEGILAVQGRLDRMFISGGENIFCEEIEEACRGINGVRDCVVVVGEDNIWGGRPVLYIEPEGEQELKQQEVKSRLLRELARFKVPKEIEIVAELPRTALGKVSIEQLKKRTEPS